MKLESRFAGKMIFTESGRGAGCLHCLEGMLGRILRACVCVVPCACVVHARACACARGEGRRGCA
eukprot:381223-Pleurochrysis_carterae.AAC.3